MLIERQVPEIGHIHRGIPRKSRNEDAEVWIPVKLLHDMTGPVIQGNHGRFPLQSRLPSSALSLQALMVPAIVSKPQRQRHEGSC